ncbi:MAG: hypothetical protein WBX50_11025 [Candidatus Deferrimicrobiaceae bacterium]
MRHRRVVCRIMIGILTGALAAGIFPLPGMAQGAEAEPPSLSMEELEVRGFRDKPGQLYVSVPNRVFSPPPVRFDLFREDLARPIPPWEITGEHSGRDRSNAPGKK